MRSFFMATAIAAAAAMASPASAQTSGHHGGMSGGHTGGGHWQGGQSGGWTGGSHSGGQWNGGGNHWNGGGHRWGSRIGGHWWGGVRAPGGWAGYHRPVRGWTLPRYWIAPGFYISNWSDYGLSEPPYGYNWSRYYDDAVLADSYGRVYDSRSGLDWNSYDGGYDDDAYDNSGIDDQYDDSHDVGPGYGVDYPPPPGTRIERREYRYEGTPPPVVTHRCESRCGGYVSRGYYYPPATTTVVTVASAPVVTTTTTDYIEEVAAPVHHVVKHTYVKRKWHAKPTPRRWKYTKHKARCAC